MPWLYFSCKEREKEWSRAWQKDVQKRISFLENVEFSDEVFVAESARLFAEPGRAITIGQGSSIAAGAFLHGPITIGQNVSVNPRCHFDGSRAGIIIKDNVRIAHEVSVIAFDHGTQKERLVREQPVRSRGITICEDVWIGAKVGITDGVHIGRGAVVGMGAIVTKDVAAYQKVAGVPARVIGERT